MFFFQQALIQIISPLFLTILLILLGILSKKKLFFIISISLLIFCSMPIISFELMAYVESNSKISNQNSYDGVQAIVVLGGYVSIIKSEGKNKLQWGGADRFFKGVEYAKSHPEIYLVLTNEKLPWMDFSEGTGELLANYATSFGVLPQKVLITEGVKNTQDEAVAVAKLLSSKGLEKIILVTSAFHMRRALDLFSKAGLEAEPMLADLRGSSGDIGILKYIPSTSALSMTEVAIRELCLYTYYHLFGGSYIKKEK